MARRITSGRPPAQEILQAGVDADRGEKVNQKEISGRKVEFDGHSRQGVDNGEKDGEQKPAGDRFGDREFTQHTDNVVQTFTDEEDNNAQCHGQEGLQPQDVVLQFHLWSPKTQLSPRSRAGPSRTTVNITVAAVRHFAKRWVATLLVRGQATASAGRGLDNGRTCPCHETLILLDLRCSFGPAAADHKRPAPLEMGALGSTTATAVDLPGRPGVTSLRQNSGSTGKILGGVCAIDVQIKGLDAAD